MHFNFQTIMYYHSEKFPTKNTILNSLGLTLKLSIHPSILLENEGRHNVEKTLTISYESSPTL